MSLFDEVNERFSKTLDQNANALSSMAGNVVKGFNPASAGMAAARAALGKYAPGAYGPVSKALSGDFVGAGIDALRQTKIGAKINDILTRGTLAGILNQSFGNPLLGGLTLFEAEQMLDQIHSIKHARKNLFFLEIRDFAPQTVGIAPPSDLFNLFATAVQFSPVTLAGDSKQIGSGSMDGVQGRELVQLRVTTLDDAYGQIKRWFETRSNAVARPDGTFGLPVDYLVMVRILHAAINDETMAKYGGYEQRYIMRCSSIETEMSRNEQGMQELQLAFTQFDTFMYNQNV